MIRALFAAMAMLLAVAIPASAETRAPQSQSEITLSFAPLVKRSAPAVVNIYARRVTETQVSPFKGDPFFEQFLGGFGAMRPRVQNSLGSGVILSGDGIVVSNYHVVEQATDIRVVLSDRREFTAEVVLGDKEADLAILRLKGAADLPYLKLRDSDGVEVGELVLAIGNPFGVGQTVSSGIVSGLARSGIATGNARGYFIQTDAPINPGNSGGALIDIKGRLIGINTAILSRSGGSNGIGFAIPANLVKQFVEQAAAGATRFERPWAGMAGQAVDFDLAGSLSLTVPEGVLISELHPASPFARAGFRVGDVITEVGDMPVNSPSEMLFRMSVVGIGGTSEITGLRDGKTLRAKVSMIAAPDDPPARETTLGERTVLPGVAVARANPAIIARYNLPLSLSGVVITDPDRLGARLGLKPGDVLVSINGKVMERSRDVVDALTRPGRRVQMELLRGGRRLTLRFRT